MKSCALIIILLALSMTANAAFEFSINCRKAYHDIICLKFDEARKKIEIEKTSSPSNPIPYLLDNYIDFLTVMISEEEKDLEKMRDKRDFRLQHLAKGDRSSPWYLYSQADIYIQWGFARIKFGEYVSAGLDINRAFRLLQENEQRFPDFIPNKIRLGLLHALVGTVPDKYHWAVKALDFEGTIPQGIRELIAAHSSCLTNKQYEFLLPETTFLLSFVTINLSGDRNAAIRFSEDIPGTLMEQWLQQSPLMCYSIANINSKAGKNDEAIRILSSCQRSSDQFPFHYLDYVLGVTKLNRLDTDAHLPFMKFVANFRGKNYIRSAYEHLAWYYLIQGNMGKYRLYMDRIKLRGSSIVDNDMQAEKDSRTKEPPDPFLLKARLLFDGGYYEMAMAQLSHFASTEGMKSFRLKLEYSYRTARVNDECGKIDDAVYWYSETIRLGENDHSYFAANASLHLGLIYENARKDEQAKQYYQKCLKLDFQEYNFSITQKAKSGLNRIRNR